MNRPIWLLFALFFSGCGSLPKAGPQAALFDFGIGMEAPSLALPNIRFTSIDAGPGLEGSGMRYRLAYQNPSRIFSYTESRWAASPDKLLTRRMQQRMQASGIAQCTLRITVETFDQIFDQPDRSRGLVQMHASLNQGNGRQGIVLSFHASADHPSETPDARGGAAALASAADQVLAEIAQWASAQGCDHPLPQIRD